MCILKLDGHCVCTISVSLNKDYEFSINAHLLRPSIMSASIITMIISKKEISLLYKSHVFSFREKYFIQADLKTIARVEYRGRI